MTCILVATHHDPDGRLVGQAGRTLPVLQSLFAQIAVHATDVTGPAALAPLHAAGIAVRQAPSAGHTMLGRARRGAVAFGLQFNAPRLLFCDFDRVLHWAECYPHELSDIISAGAQYDMLVLGRTTRAFASHPQTQRDTEAIVNQVFARVSGQPWDITAAARGLSRRAAAALVEACPEDSVGTDGAWPLFLMRMGGFHLGHVAVEGLEFETPDRYGAEIAAIGGRDRWMAQLDDNVAEWALRLEIARAEVAALTAPAGR